VAGLKPGSTALKIKRFDCYPFGTVVLTQLGVLGDLSSALEH
jgi:hypothetical protein